MRRCFGLLLSIGLTLLARTLAAQAAPAVTLEPLFAVSGPPTAMAHAGDGSGRLFVATQDGTIHLYDGTTVSTFFTVPNVAFAEEIGLLGLAFHPDFRNNGFFYVFYVDSRSGESVVARYRVSDTNPNQADPASETRVFAISEGVYLNHRGGHLAFGPDGYLYIANGDPSPFGDGAQVTYMYPGKLFRIDVNTTDGTPYRVPSDNPFVGIPGTIPEIWARGLRNPWKFSFDRATGDLFIADVGADRYEEVNLQTAGAPGGTNYGWPHMEGPECTFAGCQTASYARPVVSYSHAEGCAITGGYRYRGRDWSLDGRYVYADYCTGKIWGATDQYGTWTTDLLASNTGIQPSTFGEDEHGDLYVADYAGRQVYRLTTVPRLTLHAAAAVREGDSVYVEVGLSAPSATAITVAIDAVPGTAGTADFAPLHDVLTFAPGETHKQLWLPTVQDSSWEPEERFAVRLSDPVGAAVVNPEATVTIHPDEDPPPTLSIGDCSVIEDEAPCTFVARLSVESGFAIDVHYWSVDGTAQGGTDFQRAGGMVTLAPGQTTASIAVSISEDSEEEPTESFSVVFWSPHVPHGTVSATGTIMDDDEPIPTTAAELYYPIGSVEVMPSFQWSAVPQASRYRLSVYGADETSVLFDREYTASSVCPSSCEVRLGLTFPPGSYRWDVIGAGPSQWGPRSALGSFTTQSSFIHTLMTLAGTGDPAFNGDPRLAFTANVNVSGLVALGTNDLLLSEHEGRIRRVSPDGVIRTIAGNGSAPATGCGEDGQGASATSIPRVTALAADAHGNVYFATSGAQWGCAQVRRIDAATGLLSTVAGLVSGAGYWGDGGPAVGAALSQGISGLVVDRDGNIYISDTGNRRVRRVDAMTGVIATIAGDGIEADSGDGGPATSASLRKPRGLALDGGILYIADEEAHRIRRVDMATGLISTLAGDGTPGSLLNGPWGVTVDASSAVWIADTGNSVIRRIDPLRQDMSTYVGNFNSTDERIGDGGPALGARLSGPRELVFDAVGNLYFNDYGLHRVRRYDNSAPQVFAGPDLSFEQDETITIEGSAWDAEEGSWVGVGWHVSGQFVGWAPTLMMSLPAGIHEVVFAAWDGFGGMGIDRVQVTVRPDAPAAVAIVAPRDAILPAGVPLAIEWTASDDDPIARFEVLFSADGGDTYTPVPECSGLAGTTRSCTWYSPGPLTENGRLKVAAYDGVHEIPGFDEVTIRVVTPVPPPGNGTGLRGNYYDGYKFKDHILERLDATVDFEWGTGSPAPGVASNTFSVRWTGWVEVRYAETYTFHTVSDEGVRLWIDGRLVINNWEKHEQAEDSGTIVLEPGRRHSIRIEHYEKNGAASMRLLWSSPRELKQVIPQAQLHP